MAFDQTTFVDMLTEISKLAWKMRFEIPQEAVGDGSIRTIIAAIQDDADGTYKTDQIQAAESFRTAYANYVVATNNGSLQGLYAQLLQAVLIDILGKPRSTANDPFSNLALISEWMIDNNLYVNGRGITFDVVATETGTGTGSVARLTVDQFGQPLDQAKAPLDVSLICAQDAGLENVQFGQEVFNFSFPGAIDALDAYTGKTTDAPSSLASYNSGNGSILSDCDSWGRNGVDTSPTGQFGLWVPDDIGQFQVTEDGRFKSIGQVEKNISALALTILGTSSITQPMRNLSPGNPVNFKLEAYIPAGEDDCSITLSYGTKQKVWGIGSGLTAGQWNTLIVDMDEDLYPYNFSNGLDTNCLIEFEFEGDPIRISNFQVVEFSFNLGTFWSITPGETAFRAGTSPKVFLFEDTSNDSDTAKIQSAFAAVTGSAFPSSETTTIPEF